MEILNYFSEFGRFILMVMFYQAEVVVLSVMFVEFHRLFFGPVDREGNLLAEDYLYMWEKVFPIVIFFIF